MSVINETYSIDVPEATRGDKSRTLSRPLHGELIPLILACNQVLTSYSLDAKTCLQKLPRWGAPVGGSAITLA